MRDIEVPVFEFPTILDYTCFKDSRAAWMRGDHPTFDEFQGHFTIDLSNNAGKELKCKNLESFKDDFDMWIERPKILKSEEIDLKKQQSGFSSLHILSEQNLMMKI